MTKRWRSATLVPALVVAAAIPVATAGTIFPSAASATANRSSSVHFSLSSLAAQSREPSVAALPVTNGTTYPPAPLSGGTVSVGGNINVIGGNDVVQQATINGISVNTCNPGKDTAQNETTIASAGSTLIGGANDYRLYEPSENRYDASGGFYRSTDNGATWTAGFLPGLVRGNTAAPGPYESAGDPAVVTGPRGTFWYANLAFDRTDNANSVAVSRSADGGATWTTHFVVQTSAVQGKGLFNDKEWIGTDPSDRTGKTAYVTWTEFFGSSSVVVISKTTDGGVTWSAPSRVANGLNGQGSTVLVDASGKVYVTFEAFNGSTDAVAFAVSTNGGATFTTKLIAPVNDIPSPLPGATFRDDSYPTLALDGSTLHVVWGDWNGSNSDAVYIRSTDGGATWSSPVAIGGGPGDQFFPWVAARNGTVYATWFNRAGTGDTYTIGGAASTDGGATWSAPVTVSADTSDVMAGNEFGFPNCAFSFIGDYNAVTVDSGGVGHALWTDIGTDAFDPPGGGGDQDPYTATVTAP